MFHAKTSNGKDICMEKSRFIYMQHIIIISAFTLILLFKRHILNIHPILAETLATAYIMLAIAHVFYVLSCIAYASETKWQRNNTQIIYKNSYIKQKIDYYKHYIFYALAAFYMIFLILLACSTSAHVKLIIPISSRSLAKVKELSEIVKSPQKV